MSDPESDLQHGGATGTAKGLSKESRRGFPERALFEALALFVPWGSMQHQFLSTMQRPPNCLKRLQKAAASALLSQPIWAV